MGEGGVERDKGKWMTPCVLRVSQNLRSFLDNNLWILSEKSAMLLTLLSQRMLETIHDFKWNNFIFFYNFIYKIINTKSKTSHKKYYFEVSCKIITYKNMMKTTRIELGLIKDIISNLLRISFDLMM